jgi:LacI family transcriptional regulator
MRDVAALAGVGQKTVSRVVNDEPNVRPEMRERVLRAARQLGFRPNAAASSIRRLDQRTRTVGVVGDDIGHPFASLLIRALEKYARTRGHQFLLTASSERDPGREQALVAELAGRRVDGLVVMPTGQDESYLERERQLGIPVVFIDRPGHRWQSDAVLSDNAGAARAAVRHLAGHGHRRIAYIGDTPRLYTAEHRLEGYRAAMREGLGDGVPDHVRVGVETEDEAYAAAAEILDAADRPTALITGNDVITLGALRALHARNLRREVAIIGFDELPLADLLDPGLTVLAQDVPGLGQRAGEMLFGRIDGTNTGPWEQVVLPMELIARGSGELAPAAARRARGRRRAAGAPPGAETR